MTSSLLLLLRNNSTAPSYLASYNFMTDGTLPSGATLTRSSIGTRFNSSGVMETKSDDQARWDYLYDADNDEWVLGGLLVEPQRKNECNNKTFTVGARVTVSSGQSDIAGGTGAYLVSETIDSGSHYARLENLILPAESTNYTMSYIGKAGASSIIQITDIYQYGSNFYANFDLSNNTTGGTGSSVVASSTQGLASWTRCSLTGLSGSSLIIHGTLYIAFTNESLTAARLPSYIGNTSSNFYASFPQLEQGLEPTSYIPTAGEAVTRAAEVLTLDIPSGGTTLTLTFDDDSTQAIDVTASAGSTYEIDPTTLNRYALKTAVITSNWVEYDLDGTLPSGATLTRSSPGTRFNSSGVMVTEASDAPRWDYVYDADEDEWVLGGLLVEPQQKNEISITDSYYDSPDGGSISVNTVNNAFGNSTGDAFIDNTSTTYHRVQRNSGYNSGGATTTYIFFLKKGSVRYVDFRGNIKTDAVYYNFATFDLLSGSVVRTSGGAAASIKKYGTDLYRCSVTVSNTASSNQAFGLVGATTQTSSDSISTYTGTDSVAFSFFGNMFVKSTVTTSHIQTAGEAVTRAADVLTLDIPSGDTWLMLVFDDDSTQVIDVSAYAGSTYTLDPDTLNRYTIKQFKLV